MTDQIDPRRRPSTFELLLDFVKHRWWSIIGTVMLGIAAALYLGLDVSLPRRVKLFIIAVIAIGPYAYVAASYVVGLLWDPNLIYLVDLAAEQTDGALYALPFEEFRDLDVVEGDLDQVAPTLYFGKDVDLEAGQVRGTWRGTLEDRELLRSLSKVDECRGQLERDAKRGFAIETRAFSIIRNATRSCVRSIVRTFESKTLPDQGDSLGDEIDDALEQFDLQKELAESIDDLDVAPEDVDPPGDPTNGDGDHADHAADPTPTPEGSADD
ncbi:hypothetical protein ACKVMT_10270 [Halobacteriales archaeon Cl-PHB]